MKKTKIILIVIISLFAFLLLSSTTITLLYFKSLKPVDMESTENVEFTVKAGETTSTIISNLKSKNLIKSDLAMKIYAKLHKGALQAGDYIFTRRMSLEEIYKSITEGRVTYDTVWVQFIEGKRLDYYADVIEKNFGYSKEEIMNTLDDKNYIKALIDKYDCLTEDILNESIYHPLEGYLFADKYEIKKDATVKEIISILLDETESKLSSLEDKIKDSKYSIHQLMTLASIVELEGARSKDREGVAGVFYNRLNAGWTLGSDVTTYYAVGKDFSVNLAPADLSSCNGYNTRGTCVKGLPIGPIASPSFASIKATLNPEESDYFYFVADKNGNTYFNKTEAEHNREVSRLKSENLWFEY